jgi:nucleoside-diphosphate-sugar epimerase
MNIGIIGATGNIGQRILAEALSRGHYVTAFTRDRSRISKGRENVSWKNISLRRTGNYLRPPTGDRQLLQEITDVSGRPDFMAPVAGLHPLQDFRTAIYDAVNYPENGKRFFRMQW